MHPTQFLWAILLVPNIEVRGPTLAQSLNKEAGRVRNHPSKEGIQRNLGRPESRFPQLSAVSSIADMHATHVCATQASIPGAPSRGN